MNSLPSSIRSHSNRHSRNQQSTRHGRLRATLGVIEYTAFVKLKYHFVSFDCDGNWACRDSYFQRIFVILWHVFVTSDRRLLRASRVASAVILPCVRVSFL